MKGYFDDLCRMVGIDGRNGRSYLTLAEQLDHMAFIPRIPGDRNRADDGLNLRDGYSDAPHGDCSVFEMLVALSLEMDYTIDGMIPNSGMDIWFNQMITNLGIGMLDDAFWEENPGEAEDICEEAVQIWMDRGYEYDGSGGIFPLKNPSDDQTKVEIWYQMNAYLREILDENMQNNH